MTAPAPQITPAAHTAAARLWAIAALVGIVLYVAIDVTLAFLRPDYSLLRNAESDYGRGPHAWLMDVNFVLRGILSIFAATALIRAGLARRWTAISLGVWAFASALLAAFPDNPVGYPAHRAGAVHDLLAIIAFIGITVASVGISWGSRTVRAKTALRALSIAGLVSLFVLIRPVGAFGLIERIFLALEFAWLVVALVTAMRTRRPDQT